MEEPAKVTDAAGGARAAPRPAAAVPAGMPDAAATGGWLTDLAARVWPYARAAAEAEARARVPPLLEQSRPSFVHELSLARFSLGGAPPKITAVRVGGDAGGGPFADEAYAEFDFEWASAQDVAIKLSVPRLPLAVAQAVPDALEAAAQLLLTTEVAVSRLAVRGGARVTLRPLWPRPPVVGAVQVGLLAVPRFDYDLDMGIVPAALVPLIRAWLDGAVKELALQPRVLPERALWLPLDPAAAEPEDTPAGVLAVEVVGADGVPRAALLGGGAPSPFVELYVRDSQRRRTCVARGERRPRWREAFELPISLPELQRLTLILWDWEEWTPNNEVGHREVAVADLPPGQWRELALAVAPRAEAERRREAGRAGGLRRAVLALGAALTPRAAPPAVLRVRVRYAPLSADEAQLVALARRRGAAHALRSGLAPGAAPELRSLLLSGRVEARVPAAQGLQVSRPLGCTPVVKATLRAGGRADESRGARVSRSGRAEFVAPLEVHVGARAAERAADERVVLEVRERSWLGGGFAAAAAWRLDQLVEAREVRGEFALRDAAGVPRGAAEVRLRWRPYL